MECSFEEETTLPDGRFRHSKCIQKAKILLNINDPCYGLCYQCAYDKIKTENAKPKAKIKRLKRKVEIWQKKHDKLLKVLEERLKDIDAD